MSGADDPRALLRRLAREPAERQLRFWKETSAADKRALAWAWATHFRDDQDPPPGDWRVWLVLAGRGFGKTRLGAEWVLEQARRNPSARIALVGANIEEVDRIMVGGESGIIACSPPGEEPEWLISRGLLRFPSGAEAQAYSGAHGNGLRGPQHHFAWCDELGKWREAEATWDNLLMGLRLGEKQQVVVTTTPGHGKLLKRIEGQPGTAVTNGRTRDNLDLAASFREAMEAAYRGTRLGRQELDGVILDEADGALWTRELLERCRVAVGSVECQRVIVGVDPPASEKGDACGILVCGMASDGRVAVLADASCRGEGPSGWAAKVAAALEHWQGDRVVAEGNNGGNMVRSVLQTVAPALPVKLVHAGRGKGARAEPVAALFESGKGCLAGFFPELEDELTALTPGGYVGSGSPDRADAMVWAMSELMPGRAGIPGLRQV